MISAATRAAFNDVVLSLLCGLVLLAASRALNALLLPFLPDDLSLLAAASWLSPLDRLAAARLLAFIPVVIVLAPLLTWPLARHASRRDMTVALPGAACASVLFFLLARMQAQYPFPLWLDLARAGVLALALPVAVLLWWRYLPLRGRG